MDDSKIISPIGLRKIFTFKNTFLNVIVSVSSEQVKACKRALIGPLSHPTHNEPTNQRHRCQDG